MEWNYGIIENTKLFLINKLRIKWEISIRIIVESKWKNLKGRKSTWSRIK